MPLHEPFPDLEELLSWLGEAGQRLADMHASEGAAGNISVLVGWPLEMRRRFGQVTEIQLPHAVPELAGAQVIVTGSGRRLRDLRHDPTANLGVVLIHPGGNTGSLHTAPTRRFAKVTSEFNSHLAVHALHHQLSAAKGEVLNFHAVIHAQPPHLTYLSHIWAYQNTETLNARLMRWQPETIVQLPEGVGVTPFLMPGSSELMQANLEQLSKHKVVVWSRHGVMARSDSSILQAADRIEYAETAARYEYMNLVNHDAASGLTLEEMRRIAANFNVNQTAV